MNWFEELLARSDSASSWYYQGRMRHSKKPPARVLPPGRTYDLFLAGDPPPEKGEEWVRFGVYEEPEDAPALVAAALRRGIAVQLDPEARAGAGETLRDILTEVERSGLAVLKAFDASGVATLEIAAELYPGTHIPGEDAFMRVPTVVLHSGMQEVIAQQAFPNREDFPESVEFGDRAGNRGRLEIRRGEPALNPQILPPTETTALRESAWEIADTLDDRDVDALDLITAKWIQRARGPYEPVEIPIDEALAALGYKRKKSGTGRRGGFEPEQRRALLASLFRVDAFWLVGESVSRNKKKRDVIGTRVFTLSGIHGQTAIPLDPSAPMSSALDGLVAGADCSVSMMPGKEWGPYLFSEEARATLGWLATRALEYDPRYHAAEKRLLRYFCRLARVGANKDEPHAKLLRVETLLIKAGLEVNVRFPSRTRDRLEKALDRLQEDGLIAHWEYAAHLDLPERKWLRSWQQANITVEWSDDVKDRFHLRQLVPPPPIAIPAPATPRSRPGLGKQIRDRRRAKKLSQSACADQIGISQKSISNLERGAKPSRKVAEKVRRWLTAE